ncbi:MAG: type II toxin-antitoxin system RelE/ParE family toxin [Pirellulales bacterium]
MGTQGGYRSNRVLRRARPELADEFLAELATAVETIVANPAAFEQIRPGVRRYLLDRFPYGVYYRMPDENTVRIIVVRHHSRRPGYGLRRK